MQLIYGGKTKQSLSRFKFPDGFSLSCNPKHFNNAMESIKLINEIIIPYVQSQRKELGKPKQAALVIMDVFRGQITDDVISLLRDNNIHYVLVPNNMTQLFQPLDLTVNKHCKSYLKRLFSEWYAQQIENQLSLGKKVEEIKIEFRLTTLKPLHAKWLVEYYNEITSENDSSVIINGWKAAGIYDAIKAGSSGLQSIDPFQDISPLVTENDDSESFLPATIDQLTDELRENFVNVPFYEENPEWEQSDNEDDIDSERNIFDDIIIDDK